jgi:hypothetical protein
VLLKLVVASRDLHEIALGRRQALPLHRLLGRSSRWSCFEWEQSLWGLWSLLALIYSGMSAWHTSCVLYHIVHQPHALLHLSILTLLILLLRPLTHWLVVQYHFLHLVLVHLLVSFAHHPVEFLGIKVIAYQLSEFVGRLWSESCKYLLSFFIWLSGLKCFF